jgi:ABC-2 type transport system permease protein
MEADSDFAGGMAMSNRRLLRAYLKEAEYELVRALRAPGFSVPFLLLPVALYLLFGVVLFGDALRNDPKGALFTFTGFSVMGVMGPGMFGFGVFVAVDREQGLLTLKRALPMPTAAYLLAKAVMAIVFVAIVMVTMIAAAPVGHLRLTSGQFLSVAVINVLGALPFSAIGLFVGTRTSGKAAPAFLNLLYLPMIYLSGFLFPLPKSIQWIEFVSPAFYLNQLVLRAEGGSSHGSAIMNVAVLLGVTLLLGLLALRRLARVG